MANYWRKNGYIRKVSTQKRYLTHDTMLLKYHYRNKRLCIFIGAETCTSLIPDRLTTPSQKNHMDTMSTKNTSNLEGKVSEKDKDTYCKVERDGLLPFL